MGYISLLFFFFTFFVVQCLSLTETTKREAAQMIQ